MKMTTVKDVMTTDAVAVREDAGFREMVTLMRSQHVTALPVIDSAGRVAGLVTDADLMHKEVSPDLTTGLAAGGTIFAWHVTGESRASGVIAADMMTWPVVTVTEDATIEQAARLMQARHAKQLPVVDGNGQLRGIVSRLDVLSVFERADAEIRDDVANGIIARRFGLDPREFVETVQSGIVTVAGSVDRREDAVALLGAIRHLEGVVGVRDGLCYPPEDECDLQSQAAAMGVGYRWHHLHRRHLRRQALAG